MDTKDFFIADVVADMTRILNDEQLYELKTVLYLKMKDFDLNEKPKDIVVYNGGNDEHLKHFFVAKKIEGCSPKTLKYYMLQLRHFMRTVQKPIEQIKTEDIQLYLAYYLKERRCSKGNINNIRRILSSFFNWCRDNDIILRSPTQNIKNIKYEKKVQKPFTSEEVEKMRDYCTNNIKLRAIIEFLLSTGCRISEMCDLNKKDINFSDGTGIVMGKGSKERVIYLNTTAKFYLQKYLDYRIDNNVALFVADLYPFSRLQISGVEIAIRKMGRQLGFKAHPHKFRRTCATQLIQKGMKVELVQEVMGHKKIDTTMIYAKVADEAVKFEHKKIFG